MRESWAVVPTTAVKLKWQSRINTETWEMNLDDPVIIRYIWQSVNVRDSGMISFCFCPSSGKTFPLRHPLVWIFTALEQLAPGISSWPLEISIVLVRWRVCERSVCTRTRSAFYLWWMVMCSALPRVFLSMYVRAAACPCSTYVQLWSPLVVSLYGLGILAHISFVRSVICSTLASYCS